MSLASMMPTAAIGFSQPFTPSADQRTVPHGADRGVDRREQSGNAVFDRIVPPPAGADPAVLGRNQRLAGNRTYQDLGAVPKSRELDRRALLDQG